MANHGGKPRILVVSMSMIAPDRNSGDRRLFAILRMLSQRHSVDYLTVLDGLQSRLIEHYRPSLEAIGVHLLPYVPAIGWCLRRTFGRTAKGYGGFTAALAGGRYDLIFFESYLAAQGRIAEVRWLQPGAKVVVDTVDIHYARIAAYAAVSGASGADYELARDRELAVYRSADCVITITDEEDRLLEWEGGIRRRLMIPNIVAVRPRPKAERGPQLLFIGGFNHPPNVDGITWFVREVWGLVRGRRPDARLTVIGSNLPDQVGSLGEVEGVKVIGYVPDTNPYLDRAYLSIAPLRFGAGMKGKVSEALACGVPVVSTTFGVQGFGGVNGMHYMVADTAEEFANAVVRVLDDSRLAEAIGDAGQSLVAGICSQEPLSGRLLAGLQRLMADRDPRSLCRPGLAYRLVYGAWGGIWGLFRAALSLPIANGR